MYKFNDEDIENSYSKPGFRIDKDFITGGYWKTLSHRAKAAYPVIGIHTDKKNIAFPGIDRISVLSGLCEKSVCEAVKDMEKLKILKVERRKDPKTGATMVNQYELLFPWGKSGITFFDRYFCFPQYLVYSAHWAALSPVSKAIYIAMGGLSEPIWIRDPEITGRENEVDDEITKKIIEKLDEWEPFKQHTTKRKAFLSYSKIESFAGVSRSSIPKALKELRVPGHEFIEILKVWRNGTEYIVNLITKKYWKPEYVNENGVKAVR